MSVPNIYRLMGLRVPSCSVAGRSIECMFRSNLCDQKDFIARITESNAKTLILYGGKDSLIEESVSRHFVTTFPGNSEHICPENSSDRTLLKKIERSWRERKHVSIFCPDDGHFIQSTGRNS